MSVKSLRTQLIGAIAMVLVATLALGSSTFAWFSINSKVTVTGMEVKTQVSDNLQIALSELGETTIEDDADFRNAIHQNVQAVLEPASTINGNNYWYTKTTNVLASGNAISDEYIPYSTVGLGNADNTTLYGNKFSENYNVTKDNVNGAEGKFPGITKNYAEGYVDYVFQLKATNAGDSDLIMSKVNLLYHGDAVTEKAYRVAVFVEKWNSTAFTNGESSAVPGLVTILKSNTAAYFDNVVAYNVKNDETGTDTDGNGVYEYTISGDHIYGNTAAANTVSTWYAADDTGSDVITTSVTLSDEASAKTTNGKAVDSASTLAAVSNLGAAAVLDDNVPNGTTWYKVVVRLWLEGEDTTCNNETYALLTSEWTLDLKIELVGNGSGTPADVIGTVANASYSGSGASRTVALENDETATGWAWKNAANDTDAAGNNADTASFTADSDGTYYCLISTSKGNIYRSPDVFIDVTP